MKNILITGGPVHAHLDSVKIITNRFRGGLMADLANKLSGYDVALTYLCPEGYAWAINSNSLITVRHHDGLEDYKRIVLELAPEMDAVVLGAAVANLVPVKPFHGKFPSHNYKPDDVIPIDFTIAPRIIDEVKKVAPQTNLFGFKLLSDVANDELIRAAYEVLLASGATAVFANDTGNLNQKYAVTKERGVHPLTQSQLASWIWEMINDEYYKTYFGKGPDISEEEEVITIETLISKFAHKFTRVENGMIFGTVAVRGKNQLGFYTTGRGKRELDEIVHVLEVSHEDRDITVLGSRKASLNAPLLAKIFENLDVDYIVHYHDQEPGLPTFPYAPPGTVRDTNRPHYESFNIKEHGCMLMFDKEGNRL